MPSPLVSKRAKASWNSATWSSVKPDPDLVILAPKTRSTRFRKHEILCSCKKSFMFEVSDLVQTEAPKESVTLPIFDMQHRMSQTKRRKAVRPQLKPTTCAAAEPRREGGRRRRKKQPTWLAVHLCPTQGHSRVEVVKVNLCRLSLKSSFGA